MTTKANLFLMLILLALPVLLSACNTVEGAGEDIQSGGRAIERTANENK